MSDQAHDPGPWHVDVWNDKKVVLQSDHFQHDVALIVDGDFESHEQRVQYAKNLANWMNEQLGKPTPKGNC